MKKLWKTLNPELVLWISGLIFLAFYPFEEGHFSICPISNLGFSFCPGCGLGLSIHHLFHLDFNNSFQSHPLGIFGLLVISMRIYTLSRTLLTQYIILTQRNYNGKRLPVDAQS